MAILQGHCMVCGHKFYVLHLDCNNDDQIFCPLCEGGVDLTEIKKSPDRRWAKCVHTISKGKCKGCDDAKC